MEYNLHLQMMTTAPIIDFATKSILTKNLAATLSMKSMFELGPHMIKSCGQESLRISTILAFSGHTRAILIQSCQKSVGDWLLVTGDTRTKQGYLQKNYVVDTVYKSKQRATNENPPRENRIGVSAHTVPCCTYCSLQCPRCSYVPSYLDIEP